MIKPSAIRRDPKARVLFIDDDLYFSSSYAEELTDAGYEVTTARSTRKTLELIRNHKYEVAIVDVMMPPGVDLSSVETHGGLRTGVALARRIREQIPGIRIVGLSNAHGQEARNWFEAQESMVFVAKSQCLPLELVRIVDGLLGQKVLPRIFIVHGRAREVVLELKNFIQNALQLGEPLILSEQPSLGMTIIEKFERHARRADVVFVLLTPDDVGSLAGTANGEGRARQNAIFELGYFLGKLGRLSGRVLVLLEGPIEIPTEIAGLAYIDIGRGIEAVGEQIRGELLAWL